MIRYFSMLIFVASLSAFAAPKTASQKAVDTFLKAQSAEGDKELREQIENLNKAGYTRKGGTQAVILGGGCGFAGCNYDFLATTEFARATQHGTAVVAGIVEVWTSTLPDNLKRVLS